MLQEKSFPQCVPRSLSCFQSCSFTRFWYGFSKTLLQCDPPTSSWQPRTIRSWVPSKGQIPLGLPLPVGLGGCSAPSPALVHGQPLMVMVQSWETLKPPNKVDDVWMQPWALIRQVPTGGDWSSLSNAAVQSFYRRSPRFGFNGSEGAWVGALC